MSLLIVSSAICLFFMVLSAVSALFIIPSIAFLGVLLGYSLRLLHQSRTDALTGLYNLRYLNTMKRRYHTVPRIAVWYFDMDHLKQVNDTEGHAAGDRLLTEFADSLRRCPHKSAKAYRIGGDEFLLIASRPSDHDEQPQFLGQDLPASWGLAAGPGLQLDDLIAEAERKMYQKRRT